MDISKIIAVSGKPGLFKQISQSARGLVLEAIPSGKRLTVFGHERLSALEEISIYTWEDDVPLAEIFKKIHDKIGEGAVTVSTSDPKELRKFFTEVLPDHDQERVYNSNIKKIVTWYNLLLENNLLDFTEEETPEETPSGEEKE